MTQSHTKSADKTATKTATKPATEAFVTVRNATQHAQWPGTYYWSCQQHITLNSEATKCITVSS